MGWQITDTGTFPPGTTLFFETAIDQNGNLYYTGDMVVVGPSGESLPDPIPPSYGGRPDPGTTGEAEPEPNPDPESPKAHLVSIKEGMRVSGGDAPLLSTGPVLPATVRGWVNPENIAASDDLCATTVTPDGVFSDGLEAMSFPFAIPDGAVITGIKVTVKRSKI